MILATMAHRMGGEQERILVVDDDVIVLQSIIRLLNPYFQLLEATSVREACEILRRERIAVLLCDLHLPDGSGVEVLEHAKALQPFAERLLLTGTTDLCGVSAAVNLAQVTQLVLKPWENSLLLQRMLSAAESYRLRCENDELQQLSQQQYETISRSHRHMKKDLRIGGEIQSKMLMGKIPEDLKELEVEAITIPSKEIDGDFYDFYRPHRTFFDVVIGDVMGKGLPAAFIATIAKNHLSRFALPFNRVQFFQKTGSWRDDLYSPQEVMELLKGEISAHLDYLEYFITIYYGRFDFQKQQLIFVDCGGPKFLWYRAKEKEIVELKGDNFPIGIFPDQTLSTKKIHYREGDLFLFFSDGVIEARSPAEELFGLERVKKLFGEGVEDPCKKIIERVKDEVFSFTEGQLNDDLTLVALRIPQGSFNFISCRSESSLILASSLSQTKLVRDFVKQLCLEAPVEGERLISQMELVVTEVFSNIVKHSYRGNRLGEIILSGKLVHDGICFTFSDQGESFDPELMRETTFSTLQESGFGWRLICSISDEIRYSPKGRSDGWNHLHLFKYYVKDEAAMEISHVKEGDLLIVTLESETLDAKDADQFKQKLFSLIESEEVYRLIFDLHRLKFIDSSGLGAFISILKVVHRENGDLRLAGMSKSIRTMFELVCMHKIFEIFPSVEEAIYSFHS